MGDTSLQSLQFNVRVGNIDQVEALLKKGVHPDDQRGDTCTPLHLAAFNG